MYKVQIWSVFGYYGFGKTLLLTYLGHLLQDYYTEIVANYRIHDVKNYRMIKDFNVNIIRNMKKGSLCLYSEAYKKLDCRESMKKDNIDVTHEFQQFRKDGLNLIYDAERPQLIELRLRRITNKFIRACGNFRDILKSERSIYAQIEPIQYVKRVINTKSFWDTYEIDDLQTLFLYENCVYDYCSDTHYGTGRFFVLDGKKYFNLYDSEERINKGLLEYSI